MRVYLFSLAVKDLSACLPTVHCPKTKRTLALLHQKAISDGRAEARVFQEKLQEDSSSMEIRQFRVRTSSGSALTERDRERAYRCHELVKDVARNRNRRTSCCFF